MNSPLQSLYPDGPPISDWNLHPGLADLPILALLLWAAILILPGLALRPLLPAWCHRLADGGWLLAKACGWILWSLLAWWAATLQLLPNQRLLYIVCIAILAAAALWTTRHKKQFWNPEALRKGLKAEGLWWSVFAAAVLVRLLNPDVWHPYFGGEKFMEISMMHGVVRSPYFPPQDPYFAGAAINYYYWGYQLFTPLIKLLGLPPTSAFNLALPTLVAFAVMFTGQFLRNTITRTACLTTGILVGTCTIWIMLGGNPFGLMQDAGYWDASRRIPYTVNEFPAWSFLFADLHPHVFNLMLGPAFLLALTMGLPALAEAKKIRHALFAMAPAALVLSALSCINPWDAPGYVLLSGALAIAQLKHQALRVLLMFIMAAFFHLPFYLHYEAVGVGGLGFQRAHTAVEPWFSMWGFHLALGLLIPLCSLKTIKPNMIMGMSALVALSCAGILILIGQPVCAIILLPLVLIAYALCFGKQPVLPLLLQGLGWCILFGVEWIFIRDFYDGGEWYRMNTVFKFGLQAWLLLGFGMTLQVLHGEEKMGLPRLALPLLVMLVSSTFLLRALPARLGERMENPAPPQWTLDGTAFMKQGRFTYPPDTPEWNLAGEWDALNWLRDQAGDTPRIILEAPLGYYREMGCRTASLTGHLLPIGMHQYAEQREPIVALTRQKQVDQLWLNGLPHILLQQIDALGIEYIYVGELEKRTIRPATLVALKNLQLNDFLHIVFENEAVTIYERRRDVD